MNYLITYMFTDLEHEKKDKLQVPQRNELLSLYGTELGFISKKNIKNIIPNKIYLTVGIWKTWYPKKVVKQ